MCIAAAIVGGAVIGAGASLASSNAQSKAIQKAGQAQQQAADTSVAESQRQYDTTRADFAPYLATGTGALNRLNSAASGDMSGFFTSPSYNFTRTEGQRDIGNSFAAKGGAASGNALKALTQFNQGLASNEYNNWFNQNLGLANLGASGTSGVAQAGANSSNQIVNTLNNNGTNQSNLLVAGGNARASGIAGIGDAANQGIGNYLTYNYLKGKGYVH